MVTAAAAVDQAALEDAVTKHRTQVESEVPTTAQNEVRSPYETDLSPQVRLTDSQPGDLIAAAPDPEAPPAISSESRWVAESVPMSAEEASLALDKEMQQAQSGPTITSIEPATVEPTTVEPTTIEPATREPALATPEATNRNSDVRNSDTSSDSAGASFPASSDETTGAAAAAFAAAASAGLPAFAESPVASESEPPVASEAVAAWDNWQQIRDSVMSPQKAAAIAESAALIVHANAAAEDGAPSSQPILESSAIANIVDSVLAELKPKLMQEIAKKMAAEKK
jgi:hypothetical protein